MKKLTKDQVKIHWTLTNLLVNEADGETRSAIESANCAFLNSINHGVNVNLIEGDELLKQLREIDPTNKKIIA